MFENVIADMLGVNGVKGVYIVDREGSLIEAESVFSDEDDVYAALIADAFNKASEVLEKLSSDEAELVLIDGKDNRIIASKAGDLIFGVVAEQKTNYGLLKIEMKKAVEKISAMV
ncbi:roadblock/LC7 domain-containing protein [Archaeoglobus neptunius]|uniref:roadblock/LC7 domain-containing protein n=1 Tax=Archaeoglobus neptunius TaxID=2798580 RepID=UPI00192677E3|nr:roadblock/LC7 domain-containing protein [Archaeoglobus neptunius]